jgi:hypothetical protein
VAKKHEQKWNPCAKSPEDKEKSDSSEEIVDTFRVIGLRRKKGESLVYSFLIILKL